jgi:FixJ family two-component response regulator
MFQQQLKTSSILVGLLDPDQSALRVTNHFLSLAGYQVRPFSESNPFLKYVRSHAPHVAIIAMGGKNSQDLKVAARLQELSPATSVIISLKVHRTEAQRVLRPVELIKQIESLRPLFERRANGLQKNVNSAQTRPEETFTVCLLDDDPSVLKATGRLLFSAGWNVESFTDPHAFLGYAQIHRPALAVIDIRMPIMNGFEVQQRLRGVSPSTRVIILTSKDDSATRTKAMSGGAAGFFLKAVDDEEFLAGIEAALVQN